jgi:uncharacterized alpha-E superfamily protein
MERADGILRMLKINYAWSQDDIQEFSWKPVLRIFTSLDAGQINEFSQNNRDVLQYMVTGKENSNSVLNIVTLARENARSVQDHITKEMWQCLNDFYHTMRDDNLCIVLQKEDPITVLDILIRQGLIYVGTTDVTMARGEGNSFLNIGKFLERAIQSADILDVKISGLDGTEDHHSDAAYWKYLLLSISGYELYLKTYRGGFEIKNVVEQVVLSDRFPRSVIYSVNQLHRHFERLKTDHSSDGYDHLNFTIGKLKSRIKFSTSSSIVQEGLHKYLGEIRACLVDTGLSLNQHYFA